MKLAALVVTGALALGACATSTGVPSAGPPQGCRPALDAADMVFDAASSGFSAAGDAFRAYANGDVTVIDEASNRLTAAVGDMTNEVHSYNDSAATCRAGNPSASCTQALDRAEEVATIAATSFSKVSNAVSDAIAGDAVALQSDTDVVNGLTDQLRSAHDRYTAAEGDCRG